MLYDPKWEQKADPLSRSAFIAWLEQRPPDAAYDYYNCGGMCLFGLYMTAIGMAWSNDNYMHVSKRLGAGIACGRDPVTLAPHWTFGSALKRARALAQ